jgi:hypothetical protein
MPNQHYKINVTYEVLDRADFGLNVNVRRNGSDGLAEDEGKVEASTPISPTPRAPKQAMVALSCT